jgi:hypothetical protein
MRHNISRHGLAALAAAAFLASTVPVTAGEFVDSNRNYFLKHGLPIPGESFKKKENQQPVTIAVSKSGTGIGEQKQTTSKTAKKQTKKVQSANSGSQK